MSQLGVEYSGTYVLTGPDGARAVFNNTADADFVGMLSPESSGLDSADVREDAQDATEADGGVHGDFYYGRRPVILQGTIIATSKEDRNNKVTKLQRASNAMRGDAVLKWKPSGAADEVELSLRRQQPLRITGGFVKSFNLAMVSAAAGIKSVNSNTLKLAITGGTINTQYVDGGEIEITDIVATSEFLYFIVKHKLIKRCKLDGTGLTTLATVEEGATGLVVGATKLMWTNITKAKIGRCSLTGTEIENAWLTVEGQPDGICSDGTWLYWCDFLNSNIGRVKVGGTEQTNKFITGCHKPTGIAVNEGFLYWLNQETKAMGVSTTAGTFVNQEGQTGFPGVHGGIEVVGSFIYIVYLGGNIIMRMPKAGGQIETLIPRVSDQPTGIAINSEFIYWCNFTTKYIGRASLAAKMSGKISSNGTLVGGVEIKVPGPASFIVIKNATTGKSLILGHGYIVGAGQKLVVDTEKHTVKDNSGNNFYYAYTFPSSWLELALGENTIETNSLIEVEVIAPNSRWV